MDDVLAVHGLNKGYRRHSVLANLDFQQEADILTLR